MPNQCELWLIVNNNNGGEHFLNHYSGYCDNIVNIISIYKINISLAFRKKKKKNTKFNLTRFLISNIDGKPKTRTALSHTLFGNNFHSSHIGDQ
jgi:hypothetical protein